MTGTIHGLAVLAVASTFAACSDTDAGSPEPSPEAVEPRVASGSEVRPDRGVADRSGRRGEGRRSRRSSAARARPGQAGGEREPSASEGQTGTPDWKPAALRIITNFSKADVTVNGMEYPDRAQTSEGKVGMVLPAGGPYLVEVEYDDKRKVYEIGLEPYQVRYLVVELSGYKGGAVASSSTAQSGTASPSPSPSESTSQQQKGRVTVYSKPKGRIFVGGSPRKQQTPGTVEVEAGRHDIQVKFEGGEQSETKTVRVREGSRIKLFFRKE